MRNKYNARKTTRDGIKFDSQKEADRYQELKLAEYAGQIKDLKLQPEYQLLPAFTDNQGRRHRAIVYRADFEYVEDGQVVTEDVKGMMTKDFKLKSKLFQYHYRDRVLRIT
jgi:hypothetical protein